MSTQNNGPEFTLELDGTVAEFKLVKLVAGLGVVTGGVASEDGNLVAVAQEDGVDGEKITVRSLSGVASIKVMVDGAINKGTRVFTAAAGKASATGTSLTLVGVTAEESTADGDIIEVYLVAGTNDDLT